MSAPLMSQSSAYTEALQQALAFLQEGERFAVLAHVQPDGDAISSTLAMGWLLNKLGKSYVMLNQDEIPARLSILPTVEQVICWKNDGCSETFDRVIVLDCGDYQRIGAVEAVFAPGRQMLNIDHHPTNDLFGTANLVRIDASATAEIIYELIRFAGVELDADVGTLLYTGIITDTGGFHYSNTSALTLAVASQLLLAGVEGHRLTHYFLETMTKPQVQLLQEGLANLRFAAQDRVAWIQVSAAQFNQFGASSQDLEGLVNYARNVEGVDIGILFKESEEGMVKISLRSSSAADVSEIAKQFGGGGHYRASGCRVHGSLEEAVERVVRAASEALQ